METITFFNIDKMSASSLPISTWQGKYVPSQRTVYTTIDDNTLTTVSEALDRLELAWEAEVDYQLDRFLALDERFGTTKFVTGNASMKQKQAWQRKLAAGEIDEAHFMRLMHLYEERCQAMAELCAAEGMLAVAEYLDDILAWIKLADSPDRLNFEALDIVNNQIIWWIEGHGENAMKEATLEETSIVSFEIMRDFETTELVDCQERCHEPGSRVMRCSSCALSAVLQKLEANRPVIAPLSIIPTSSNGKRSTQHSQSPGRASSHISTAAPTTSALGGNNPAPTVPANTQPHINIPAKYLAVAPDLPRRQPAVLSPGWRYMCNIGECTSVFQRKSDVRVKHMPTKHNIHGWGYGSHDYDLLGPFTSAECQALRPNKVLVAWKEEA